MDGLKIIKHIHYHIVKKYNEGHVWCIDEIISLTLATIFPYPHKSIDHKNTPCGNIEDVCNVLNGYLGRSKKLRQEIETYSYESLKQYFNDKLVTNLSWNTKIYIVNQLNIASSIENNGFISIRYPQTGCDAVLKTYKEFEVLESSGYGNVEYMPVLQVDKLDENDSVSVEDAPANKISTPDNVILQQVVTTTESLNAKKIESTNTPNTLKTLEKTPRIEKGNNKIDLSPDVVLNPEEEKLNSVWENIGYDETKMPYVWKLRISHNNYKRLKECLINCIKSLPSGYGVLPSFIRKHCIKLFVYVAEWYKWEFDGSNDAFLDFSKNINPKLIWSNSPQLWRDLFLYKVNVNNASEFSIYALGGIPLQLASGDKLNKLFNIISAKDEYEIDDDIETIFITKNKAIKQSLVSEKGSLNEYVSLLLSTENHSSLFSKEDAENELVKRFLEYLENGKSINKSLKSCLKEEWRFYTFDGDSECNLSFRVKIGNIKDGCNLSANCMKNDVQRFNLCIENSRSVIGESRQDGPFVRFTKKDDFFIGWSCSNTLRLNSATNNVNVVVYKNTCGDTPEIIQTYSIGDEFLEIYSLEDSYGWTTKKNNNVAKAVLFPLDKYIIKGDTDFEIKYINQQVWGFCRILDNITLVDSENKEYHLFKKANIDIVLSRWSDGVIRYKNATQPLVKYSKEEVEYDVNLFVGYPNVAKVVIYNSSEKKEKRYQELGLDDKKIDTYFIQGEEGRTVFNSNSLPKLGFFVLEVIHKDTDTKELLKCFFLPADFIERKLEEKKILFKDHYNIDSVLASDVLLEKKRSKFVYSDSDEFVDCEYVSFDIKTKKGDKIELDICRPIKQRDLLYDDFFFKKYVDEKKELYIPQILKDRYSLRIFDENGVRRLDFKNVNWFEDYNLIWGKKTRLVQEKVIIYDYKIPDGNDEMEYNGKYNYFSWIIGSDSNPQPCGYYDAIKSGSPVMIFQSLKEVSAPCHYFRPKYNVDYKELGNFDISLRRCYEIASEFRIPFSQFPPLSKIAYANMDVKNNDCKLFLDCFSSEYKSLTKEDYAELHRFAHEFGFEWFLMPKFLWRRCGIRKEFLKELLKSSPFVTNTTRYYFNKIVDIIVDNKINLSNLAGLNNTGILMFIRGYKKEQILKIKTKDRIKIIKELYNNNKIFFELYNTLRGKIIK